MPAYIRTADLPQVIPVFPLDGALLLPHGGLPLNIFEPRYLNMIDDAMAGDRIVGMVQTVGGEAEADLERPRLAAVGCAGRITAYGETGDGRYLITLTGVCRFRIAAELPVQTPYRQVRADYAPFEADLERVAPPPEGERAALLAALKDYLAHRGLEVDWKMAREAPMEALVNSLAMALPFDPAEKQALLEADDFKARQAALTCLLRIDAAEDDDAPPSLQ